MTSVQGPMMNQSPTLVGRGVLTAPERRCPTCAFADGVNAQVGHLRSGHWSWVLLFFTLTFARAAECCTVPVFRYGLDNWQADAYRLEFPAAAMQDGKLADFFRNLGTALPVNLEAKPGTGTEARLLFPHPEEAKSPVVWTGALTPASLAALTDSPARKEIARRILAGESVVWVLAESGDKAEDDAIAARVEKRLRYLEQVAILQPIDPNDPTSKLGPGPALRVKFSLLRAPRAGDLQSPSLANDSNGRRLQTAGTASESLLLKMLAGPKPAAELATGPWLAAVFGRGRVLGAWPAANFGDAEIEEACLFLLGACSCQVKRQNPGWDVLMNVNWTEELRAVAEKASGAATATAPARVADSGSNHTNEAQTVTISSAAAPDATVPKPGSPTVLWLGASVCAIVGLFLFARRS
ncbi:MAG: hypothetical protein FD161_2755 [Limisphaerales bacterium]|nr:MAG: hypothetical protein FD161_2755 [Limisphaerales bacterium]KAG0508253.1 MAG: hypothetical protein E1N63_2506 [Limisphaerales bacterium]TXT49568.1 MAG: hypothetical protein FD140_2894 [Limisphaerales bacterium]